MMKVLVLIHVLSAIVGVGPTFFAHVLFRMNQSLPDLRVSTKLMGRLELFPKVGGTIAVLSGLLLIWLGDYGPFTQLWLIGSLLLYILIQVVVIGFVTPPSRKLAKWVLDPANANAQTLPYECRKLQLKVNRLFYLASGLGTLLFILMIVKPA